MRFPFRWARMALLLGATALSASALTHSVTDFRPDWDGSASDTLALDPGWKDSLLLSARRYDYKVVLVKRLNNDNAGSILNTPSAGAVAAVTGDFGFKVAYLQWSNAHNATNATNPGLANVMIKNIALSPDTAAVDVNGTIIAAQEVTGKRSPIFLNFHAEGNKYAAYWGANSSPAPIRRTTYLNPLGGGNSLTWGQDVPPVSPVPAAGFGKVGSGMRPGSGGEDYALAYETAVGATNKFMVRWESLAAGTSVPSAPYTTSQIPNDFTVALDSAGNTIVLWREQQTVSLGAPSDMWMVGFDASHAEIYPPTKVETDIFADDTVSTTSTVFTHYYRPFAIASQANRRFVIVFGRRSGAQARIYARTLTLDSLGAGSHDLSPAADLTPPGDTSPFFYMYPDIKSTRDRVVVSWFKRGSTNYSQRFKGSIFYKRGPVYDTTGRLDMDFAGENIAFGAPTNGLWYQYHYFKCASVAMDEQGDLVAAYDSGSASKAALVKNSSIYRDTGAFTSRILSVRSPAFPSFTFDPARDSVAYFPPVFTAKDSAYAQVKLAFSSDSSFAAPTAGFQDVTGRMAGTLPYFRYKVELWTNHTADTNTTNLKSAKVKSLRMDYNVKPWRPRVDSLKIGRAGMLAYDSSAAYRLLPRKDSLRIVVSGTDADDDSMTFRLKLGGRTYPIQTGTRVSPGVFRAVFTVSPPDTLLDTLRLTLTSFDAEGWASPAFGMNFGYGNLAPSQDITIYRNKGRDSASVYRPSGGGVDTLHPVAGSMILMQAGDSLSVKAKYLDGNDDSVTAEWSVNGNRMARSTRSVSDSLLIRFAPDRINPWIDTLAFTVSDPNATVVQRFPIRANRVPELDSVWHGSYKAKDSTWKTGPFDKVKDFAADTGLILPAGLMTVVQTALSDSDMVYGDSLEVRWKVWRKGTSACPTGNFPCYKAADSADGETLTRVFATSEHFLTMRVTDKSGAFRERRLWLEYPVLDTAGTTDFAASVKALVSDIDFVIGADQRDTAVRVQIRSQGSAPLRVLSVATQRNDRKWLDVKLDWLSGTPPRTDSVKFAASTAVNALSGGKTITLAPGATLGFEFRFSSDSLRGDSVLVDTLLVQTNDFANPILKIPFRIVYNDLPLVTLAAPGSAPAGPGGGFNAAGLPRFLPARTNLSLSFSETVRVPEPEKVLRVYSFLDSLQNPKGFRDIHGTYTYVRTRAAKQAAGKAPEGNFGLSKTAAADSLADQLLFIPAYDRASDSLKVKPPPGFFIYGDKLRIRISNGIVDRAGNGLDLRLDKRAAAPGSFDTVFQARVDTSEFSVVRTQPPKGFVGHKPEDPIRIRFNRRLALSPPQGMDSLTLLTLGAPKAAESRAVRVTSAFFPGRAYDFQALTLEDGDSTLVVRTRPRVASRDTVTVTLSGGIADTSGVSLDGNGNHIPEWLYDRRDTVDAYAFSFSTSDYDFYVFPNPFRFGDPRHRAKGTITFKNLNSLGGFTTGDHTTLRVHTLNGDLVYDSGIRNGDPAGKPQKLSTSMEWDLKNNQNATVGTGVLIFSLYDGSRKLLRKGKLAIVR